jgi:hypothetical protein
MPTDWVKDASLGWTTSIFYQKPLLLRLPYRCFGYLSPSNISQCLHLPLSLNHFYRVINPVTHLCYFVDCQIIWQRWQIDVFVNKLVSLWKTGINETAQGFSGWVKHSSILSVQSRLTTLDFKAGNKDTTGQKSDRPIKERSLFYQQKSTYLTIPKTGVTSDSATLGTKNPSA